MHVLMAEVIFSNIGGTATGKCIASILSATLTISCKTGKSIIFWLTPRVSVSRPLHWLQDFPRLALVLVTCYPALGTSHMFSRAWHQLRVSCAWHRLNVSSRVLLNVLTGSLLYCTCSQGRSQKKLMTEAMSMEGLWPRQSVHGWVLFLGIKSVYNDYKQQKWKKLPRQVPRLACY